LGLDCKGRSRAALAKASPDGQTLVQQVHQLDHYVPKSVPMPALGECDEFITKHAEGGGRKGRSRALLKTHEKAQKFQRAVAARAASLPLQCKPVLHPSFGTTLVLLCLALLVTLLCARRHAHSSFYYTDTVPHGCYADEHDCIAAFQEYDDADLECDPLALPYWNGVEIMCASEA
jgi:hypothetical protein